MNFLHGEPYVPVHQDPNLALPGDCYAPQFKENKNVGEGLTNLRTGKELVLCLNNEPMFPAGQVSCSVSQVGGTNCWLLSSRGPEFRNRISSARCQRTDKNLNLRHTQPQALGLASVCSAFRSETEQWLGTQYRTGREEKDQGGGQSNMWASRGRRRVVQRFQNALGAQKNLGLLLLTLASLYQV